MPCNMQVSYFSTSWGHLRSCQNGLSDVSGCTVICVQITERFVILTEDKTSHACNCLRRTGTNLLVHAEPLRFNPRCVISRSRITWPEQASPRGSLPRAADVHHFVQHTLFIPGSQATDGFTFPYCQIIAVFLPSPMRILNNMCVSLPTARHAGVDSACLIFIINNIHVWNLRLRTSYFGGPGLVSIFLRLNTSCAFKRVRLPGTACGNSPPSNDDWSNRVATLLSMKDGSDCRHAQKAHVGTVFDQLLSTSRRCDGTGSTAMECWLR